MVGRLVLAGVVAASLGRVAAQDTPLVSVPGQVAAIPEWNIQSSSDVSDDLKAISKPGGADTSSWIDVPISKCTLMACLIAAGLHSDEELWYSENLKDFNWGQFTVPWVYRHEFGLEPEEGVHYLLQTNGITSRGDIYLNGELVADKDFQSGSYTGHEFDITEIVADSNALLIQAYPTDYTKDLAMGFIDWNPVPVRHDTHKHPLIMKLY
jgi:exo-1,4-beta-D-glucosaminidase